MRAERHPAYDNGVLRITQVVSPAGLAIAGEIDEATYPALVTSLHELAEEHPVVHLDLSGVSYCDLAGLRAIVRLADTVTPVTLHGVPGPLRSAMEILGWDQEPGLMISKD